MYNKPNKSHPCHWDNEMCNRWECWHCAKQLRGREENRAPQKAPNKKKPMKDCSHMSKAFMRIEYCSGCGLLISDLPSWDVFIPNNYLDNIREENNKRGNVSEITRLKRDGKWDYGKPALKPKKKKIDFTKKEPEPTESKSFEKSINSVVKNV